MGRLKLNFLGKENVTPKLNQIESILHEYGQEIYDYAKGYFNYVVTTTSVEDDVTDASLYIIVPEIGFDYKVLELSYKDINNVTLRFFTLKTNQQEIDEIEIKNNWDKVYNRISQLLNTKLANETFRFLIDQISLKRESRDE